MFVWVDIETTGLDDRDDAILSLGMIVTTDTFKEVARREWAVGGVSADKYKRMSPEVRKMHEASGLLAWAEQYADLAPGLGDIERDAIAWLQRVLAPYEVVTQPIMAGNSVHFDSRFLSRQMPALRALMHYRLLDVSTLKVLCLATVPGAAFWEGARAGAKHTPLADLDRSLAELAHWRAVLTGLPL